MAVVCATIVVSRFPGVADQGIDKVSWARPLTGTIMQAINKIRTDTNFNMYAPPLFYVMATIINY